MAASSAAVLNESPYYGQALGAHEIRLISIIWADEPLEIQTRRYELTADLEFDAVSYVWGTAPASIQSKCNGKALKVTPTVHEMLKHLHRYTPTPRRPLWIDAICINQDDPEEKATQIPLMSRIFSRAARVVVWMGPSTSGTDVFAAEFPRISEVARNWVTTGVDHTAPGVWEAHDWPLFGDPFWTGFYQLLGGEWFTRLWTFQEVVLAKQAIMLCGACWIDLDDFAEFTDNGCFRGHPYIVAEKNEPRSSPRQRSLAWQDCRLIRNYRNVYSDGSVETWDIPILLDILRPRHVNMHVDRIWALAGLFEEALQRELAPLVDYSAAACNEYWETFINFSKTFLGKEQSLGLLTIPPSTGNMVDLLPSWCPNLSGQGACRLLIVGLWNYPVNAYTQHLPLLMLEEEGENSHMRRASIEEHSRTYIWTLKDDNLLRVRGFCADTILEVVEEPRLLRNNDYVTSSDGAVLSSSNPNHVAAMDWESRSLELARRVFYGTDEGVAAIPMEYLMAFCMDFRINKQARTAYFDAMAIMRSEPPARSFFDLESSSRVRAKAFIGRFESLLGHSVFSTEGGRFGISSPGCKPGDKFCVFYGGQPLHILRWPACNDTAGSGHGGATAEFKGVAFVPHLMDLHQWEAARLSPDEIFVIG